MKKLFFAKRRLSDRRVGPFYHELLTNQDLSAEHLAELNWRRCCEMVRVAYETIPFYHRTFSKIGLEPEDLKTRTDFDKLPILEKSQIRENTGDIVDPNYRLSDLQESTTGGTTGTPLKVYHDPQIPLQVVSWRTLEWWGVSPADNSGYLYRAVPEGLKKTLHRALLWPTRRTWISAADMTADRMDAFYRSLIRNKTEYLVGYVGAVDAFASHIENKGKTIKSLKAVWTTSSPLTLGKRKLL
jgi:phenylacetate-CoA ligase